LTVGGGVTRDDSAFDGTSPSPLAGAIILDELAALGITDVVCCPGSRSAPLAYAAAHLEAENRIRLHIRLDERSAGFFALGIAKATRRAVPIITTSGTAVANLAPALAESRHAHVPLIALTADRPSNLVGTGANQTTDQLGIFGTMPLQVARIQSSDQSPQAWRAAVRRAVITAEGRISLRPGPVQINVELAEPLMGAPTLLPARTPFHVNPARTAERVTIDPGAGTVIVAGDMPPDQGRWWAAEASQAHIPLLAEPSSNARSGSAAICGYRHLLPGFSASIQRVIVTGHPTLSRPVTALLSRRDIEIIAVDASGEWPDPGWAVSRVVPAVTLGAGDTSWMNSWTTADRIFQARMDATSHWSGETIAATVMAALSSTDTLVLGSSNPIRDADLAPISSHPPQVYANRGLAGIDGTIATALGIATGLGQRVTALVGDLTALHDISALARPHLETTIDLTIVVADDHGGSLFATLEYGAPRSQIGDLADFFERLFGVPMDVDLAQVSRGFGATVTPVDSLPTLKSALNSLRPGVHLIHASVERQTRTDQEKNLAKWGREAVHEAMRRR